MGYFDTLATSLSYLIKERPNNLTSNFWGIYELEFPEVSDMTAPGDFSIPWGLSYPSLRKPLNICIHLKKRKIKENPVQFILGKV